MTISNEEELLKSLEGKMILETKRKFERLPTDKPDEVYMDFIQKYVVNHARNRITDRKLLSKLDEIVEEKMEGWLNDVKEAQKKYQESQSWRR